MGRSSPVIGPSIIGPSAGGGAGEIQVTAISFLAHRGWLALAAILLWIVGYRDTPAE
jgi:hypothetical protein